MDSLLKAAVLSFIPVSELRGGIPFALVMGNGLAVSLMVCLLANMLVVPWVFFFMDFLHGRFLRWEFYRRHVGRFLERARMKVEPKVKKWEFWGLAVFVAIPFPLTGAYTGTLGAWVLGIERRRAYAALLCGVLCAGLIVTAVYLGGESVVRAFILK